MINLFSKIKIDFNSLYLSKILHPNYLKTSIFFFLTLTWLCLYPAVGTSQIPTYYNGINFNQNGTELETDLAELISTTHAINLPYTSSNTDTWDAIKQTDLAPENTENVLLFYGYNDSDGDTQTDYTRDKDLSCHVSNCVGLFNREHVYSKSRATPSLTTDSAGSGTDAHNLRACDSDMNSARNNRLFQDDIGDAHITTIGNWYPGDEWKGDVARIIMYMHIRYNNQTPANDIGTGSNNNHAEMPDIFLQWNVDDPVSDYEIQRNPVLESMQGNRNPFIDNPYLATKIWGGNPAEEKWGVLNTVDLSQHAIKIYPIPVKDRLYISSITSDSTKVVVYNVSGQELNISFRNDYLNVEPLSKGVYVLKIIKEGKVSTYKFIKN